MQRTQRRLAALAAISAAVTLALAGCGTPPGTPSGAHPASTATQVGADSHGPAGTTRAAAVRLARQMLSKAVRPPGSRHYPGPAPAQFQQLIDAVAAGTATAHTVWQVPAPPEQAAAFIDGHIGRKSSTAPPASTAVRQFAVLLQPLPADLYQAETAYVVAPGAHGGSLLFVGTAVIWYPQRSAAEQIPAGIGAVTITATTLNHRPRTVTRTFTSAAVIGKLARLLNGLHAAPNVVMSCPAVGNTYTYRVAFAPARGMRPVVTATTGSCFNITVVAHGKGQPALWDPGYRLSFEAGALLGIKLAA